MRVFTLAALTGLFAGGPLAVAGAQGADTVAVLTAAARFARQSIIGAPGPLLIDEASYRRGPGIGEAVARRVARAVGARRGESRDVIRCEELRPRTPQRCTGAGVALTFARPDIRDSAATVDLSYTYVGYRGRVEWSEWSLELRRTKGQRWRVTASRQSGVS